MTTLGPYTVHPFADEFPRIEGEEFKSLVDDIKRNGLVEPIKLTHDKSTIVDGRNRYNACIEGTVDARFESLPEFYTDEMIVDFILSKNKERRHMSAGQLSMLALAYEKMYGAEAKKRQVKGRPVQPKGEELVADRRQRKSSDKAAKKVGASARGVQRAKAVQEAAPSLALEVKAGTTSLDAAYKQVKKQEKDKPQPEKDKPTPVILELPTHTGAKVRYPKPKAKAEFNRTKGEGISWAGWSWNPITGCLHGCKYCYARALATRDSYKDAYPVGFTPLFHHERLDAPTNTKVPDEARTNASLRRVFVCSMADLYGKWVPDEWIGKVHAACRASPQWEYLMLTKFPSRYVGLELPKTSWLGTSVDEQKRVRFAEDAFRQIKDVRVKWLSLEPLLAPLQFTDLSMFDWVVIGAQTETNQPGGLVKSFAPPIKWVMRLIDQAVEAGCKVHCKPNLLGQTSPQLPGMTLPDEYPTLNGCGSKRQHEDLLSPFL